MTAKPRKPWRVTVTGSEATTSFTTEAKTYDFIRASLSGDSPTDSAKVDHWENGTWWWYETVTANEVAPSRTTETRGD